MKIWKYVSIFISPITANSLNSITEEGYVRNALFTQIFPFNENTVINIVWNTTEEKSLYCYLGKRLELLREIISKKWLHQHGSLLLLVCLRCGHTNIWAFTYMVGIPKLYSFGYIVVFGVGVKLWSCWVGEEPPSW